MATLTLKNVPEDLYERLKASARRHRRSVNSQAIVCLEHSLRGRRLDPEALLGRIQALRAGLSVEPLTDEFLDRAKNEGRP